MKKKIPCGRIEEDKFLCCMREHHWYNSYWIPRRIKGTFKFTLERKCLFCGNIIEGKTHFFRVW